MKKLIILIFLLSLVVSCSYNHKTEPIPTQIYVKRVEPIMLTQAYIPDEDINNPPCRFPLPTCGKCGGLMPYHDETKSGNVIFLKCEDCDRIKSYWKHELCK
jgi:hypothetical protein